MAKLFIQDTTLTAIADAIRSKTSGGSGEPIVVSSHTSNLLHRDDTVVGYGLDGNTSLGAEPFHDVITIPGAVKMHLDLKYQTDSMFAQIQISSGDVENTDTWGKGEYKYTKHQSIAETTLDIEGTDTITINFINQATKANIGYWGFWIDVTGYDASGNQVTGGGANTTQYKPTEMPAAILSISGEGGGGITPSGELEITENGSYDVTTYASAQVSVPVGVFPTGTLPITQNGEYSVESYASVLVDVASGGGELEPIVLTGSCDYACAGKLANSVIPQMAGKISTNNIYQAPYMFNDSGLEEIPFELNFYPNYDMSEVNHMFFNADIKKFPTIKNLNPKNASQMFSGCQNLTDIPEGATTTWSFNKWQTSTAAQVQHMFKGCSRLRRIDSNLLKNLWNCNTTYLYNAYYYLFSECTSLDEVRNLGVSTAALTGNAFNNTFTKCGHLKNFTFVSGKSANWKSQIIDLTTVGFLATAYETKSADFTSSLKVTSLESYEALNSNPNWWTDLGIYSRYNHDSAVATINSLPTITASGATNTLKLRGNMGSGYGKAISDLTEAEIAVATAKGWTVSIT